MKLPVEFGIKLIFRLVFAGVILAAALYPLLQGILRTIDLRIKIEFLFPIAVIIFGWLVLICDMRVYMLFEGRRYWPRWAKRVFVWSEEKRLKKLEKIVASQSGDRRVFLEAGVELGLFPVNDNSESYVAHPTRLGNLIESFETYPKVKYGLDSVFYWYRLWVVLDKDIREEIENAQSIVDSTVYVAFALYVSGSVMFGYAGLALLSHAAQALLHWQPLTSLPYVPGPLTLCGLGAVCLMAGYLTYRLSLTAHAQFGELFKSIFDQFRSKLQLDDILKEVSAISDSPHLSFKSRREKNQIIWRYLRWHLIRDDAVGKNLTVKEWKKRLSDPSRTHTS